MFSSLTEGRQGKDQTRRLENPVARGPSSQRRMTHSSGTVWILSLAAPPSHPQAKRPDGEGSESGRPPTPEECRDEGASACKAFFWLSPCFPPCSFSAFSSASPLLSSLSVYPSPPSSLPIQVFVSTVPLLASESQTLFFCLSAPLLFLFFLCFSLTAASSHLLRASVPGLACGFLGHCPVFSLFPPLRSASEFLGSLCGVETWQSPSTGLCEGPLRTLPGTRWAISQSSSYHFSPPNKIFPITSS